MGIGQGDTFYLSNELVLKLNGLPCSVDVINIGLICGDGECESYEHYCPEDCGWFWVHRENTTSIFYNGVNYDVTADGTCGISGEVDLNFTYDTTIDSFTGLSQEDIFSLSNDLGLILNSLPCMSDVINIGIQ